MKPHEFTAGITDELLGPRQNVIPFDLDPDDDEHECGLCGYRSSYPDLMRTILKHRPEVVSWRCVDMMSCIRRRRAA